MSHHEQVLQLMPLLVSFLLFALNGELLDVELLHTATERKNLELGIVDLFVDSLLLVVELLIALHLFVVHLLHLGIKFNLSHSCNDVLSY